MTFDVKKPRRRMTRRERNAYYFRKGKRDALIELGGECVCCGEDDLGQLSFDHINPDDKLFSWSQMRRMNRWSRLAYYRRMIKEDKIQAMCIDCNRRKNGGAVCPCKEAA